MSERGKGISYTLTKITPELAQAWLQNANSHNRKLRDHHALALSRDMAAGRWHDTATPIKFDRNGVLLDGQHRLQAIVISGATIEMLVIRGLEPEVQDFMDTGLKRSVADALHLEGKIKYRHAAVASIARAVASLEGASGFMANDPKRRPTDALVLDTIRRDPEGFEEAAFVSQRAREQGGLRGGVIYGVAYYKLAKVDPEDAETFFQQLISGEDLRGGNPIYALRQKLLITPPSTASKTMRNELFFFIKAWNYWREKKDLRVLRWSRNEDYPEAI